MRGRLDSSAAILSAAVNLGRDRFKMAAALPRRGESRCGLACLSGADCLLSEEAKEQRSRSKLIDRQLARDKLVFRRTVKVLLLGSGESGKSTFLKQMRIINGKDFDDGELRQYRLVVYGNVVKGMKVCGKV